MRAIKQKEEIEVCFWMVFCPGGEDKKPGIKPYAAPSNHPNSAKQHAIRKKFGIKPGHISAHELNALWDFLYSKGFRIKRCISISTDQVCVDPDTESSVEETDQPDAAEAVS
jgi:hypothetical protein